MTQEQLDLDRARNTGEHRTSLVYVLFFQPDHDTAKLISLHGKLLEYSAPVAVSQVLLLLLLLPALSTTTVLRQLHPSHEYR